MENNRISKRTISFGLALVASCVINALLVVAKEKSPAVQAGMQRLTGHHWITHSVVVVVCFLMLGWLLARANGGQGIAMTADRLIKTIVGGLLAASAIIMGFYLMVD